MIYIFEKKKRVFENLQLYKTEYFSFPSHFFNRDISLNMLYPLMKFCILILDIVIEGTVSQNFNVLVFIL